MTFIPSEALKAFLNDISVCSYRLVDGTYIIAENIDTDEENNILNIAAPLQLTFDDLEQKSYLRPWIDTEEDELVQLAGDKIIGFTETPFALKLHYHRYFLIDKLKDIMTDNEINNLLFENTDPPVDNQDLIDDDEGEEWKIDNGISDSSGLQEDKGYQSTSDYHSEWRKKHKGKE